VIEAAAIRLRPVLMTSLCTAFGALPLMLASGAGAEARQAIGVVVFYGVVMLGGADARRGARRVHPGRAQHGVAADGRQAHRSAAPRPARPSRPGVGPSGRAGLRDKVKSSL